MARGNDAAAAAAEFRGQYGLQGNAEDLIQASRAAYPADLRAANLLGRDTDYDHDEHADDLGGKVENGRVLDSAKHGDYIVAVVETESGHAYKAVFPASDLGIGSDTEDRRTDDEKAADEVAEAEMEARLIIAKARAEAERLVADAVQEAQQQASEQAQDAVQQAQEARASTGEGEGEPEATSTESGTGSEGGGESGQQPPAERAARRQRGGGGQAPGESKS